MPSSRGSSWPRDWTRVSCNGRWILYHWVTWEDNKCLYFLTNLLAIVSLWSISKTYIWLCCFSEISKTNYCLSRFWFVRNDIQEAFLFSLTLPISLCFLPILTPPPCLTNPMMKVTQLLTASRFAMTSLNNILYIPSKVVFLLSFVT